MSNFKIIDTEIADVKLIEPSVFDDNRGHFFESFNKKSFDQAIGLNIEFVQDNQSFSKLGVLRGLHKQSSPYEQAKLVRVVFGEVFDVAVDVREESPTFGKWVGEYLSSENYKQLWIPEGFAHGFLTMSENAVVLYKTNNFYNKESEVSINPFDKELNIKWPEPNQKIIMSTKDLQSINFKDLYD